MATAKKFYATRDFNDAGTERAFNAGDEIKGKVGELANYLAAGLVSDEKPKLAETSDPVGGAETAPTA